MNTNTELFQEGVEQLKNTQVALDPHGRVLLDGYVLLVVDNDGLVHVTKRTPKLSDSSQSYVKTLTQFKNVNWKTNHKPNTPSVEMLLSMYFNGLSVKAYAMWATSSTGVSASTFAVYNALNTEENIKFCDTMETCLELYKTDLTFTSE